MKKKKVIWLYQATIKDAPKEIQIISEWWTMKANRYGDHGSCVLGASMDFDYKGQSYELSPMSQWQGSLSWEVFQEDVKEALVGIGATNVRFNYGRMD